MKLSVLMIAVALAPIAATAAQEYTVTQKNKAFSAATLTVHAGDKVNFRNEDAFVHNVFSLTDAQPFDLGTYPQGQAKTVTFAKPGTYDIECAIHPEMKLTVVVAP